MDARSGGGSARGAEAVGARRRPDRPGADLRPGAERLLGVARFPFDRCSGARQGRCRRLRGPRGVPRHDFRHRVTDAFGRNRERDGRRTCGLRRPRRRGCFARHRSRRVPSVRPEQVAAGDRHSRPDGWRGRGREPARARAARGACDGACGTRGRRGRPRWTTRCRPRCVDPADPRRRLAAGRDRWRRGLRTQRPVARRDRDSRRSGRQRRCARCREDRACRRGRAGRGLRGRAACARLGRSECSRHARRRAGRERRLVGADLRHDQRAGWRARSPHRRLRRSAAAEPRGPCLPRQRPRRAPHRGTGARWHDAAERYPDDRRRLGRSEPDNLLRPEWLLDGRRQGRASAAGGDEPGRRAAGRRRRSRSSARRRAGPARGARYRPGDRSAGCRRPVRGCSPRSRAAEQRAPAGVRGRSGLVPSEYRVRLGRSVHVEWPRLRRPAQTGASHVRGRPADVGSGSERGWIAALRNGERVECVGGDRGWRGRVARSGASRSRRGGAQGRTRAGE